MSYLSLTLVVLAAFIHAGWNLLAKRGADAGANFVLVYTGVALLAYAPWVVWLIASGLVRWSGPVLLCVAASGVLHLGYSLCLQRGYRVADLSVVYPVARGTGPMLSSLGAFVLLGEPATAQGLAGLAAVVGGIALIATGGEIGAFRRPEAQRGLRWGVGTGGLIAGYTVVDGYGVKALGIQPVALDWCANVLRFALLAPAILREPARARAAMRGSWGAAVVVGLLSPLSYILVLSALRIGAPLSLVAPAREMSMMVGALLGLAVLREPVGPARLCGCALVVAGVVLLAA